MQLGAPFLIKTWFEEMRGQLLIYNFACRMVHFPNAVVINCWLHTAQKTTGVIDHLDEYLQGVLVQQMSCHAAMQTDSIANVL